MAINLARWCRSPVRQSMLQWAGVDLMYRLAAAASVLLLCATGFVAALVSTSIGKAIVDRYGAEAALFTDSFVAPRIQELAERSTLLENKKVELDGLFAPTVVGRPILAFRIWKDDQVIYSNNREMIGRRFPLSPARARAWEGGVSTELNQLDGDDEGPDPRARRAHPGSLCAAASRPERVALLRSQRPTRLAQTSTTRYARLKRWYGWSSSVARLD